LSVDRYIFIFDWEPKPLHPSMRMKTARFQKQQRLSTKLKLLDKKCNSFIGDQSNKYIKILLQKMKLLCSTATHRPGNVFLIQVCGCSGACYWSQRLVISEHLNRDIKHAPRKEKL
jgi:hypothetical protein